MLVRLEYIGCGVSVNHHTTEHTKNRTNLSVRFGSKADIQLGLNDKPNHTCLLPLILREKSIDSDPIDLGWDSDILYFSINNLEVIHRRRINK